MSLARALSRLGYGTRREAEALIAARRVTSANGRPWRASDQPPPHDILVDGEPLDPPAGSVVLLHKPVGYVCSTSDRPPLVYELLPARFPHRDPVMATVGRLDADTSGLLLLTDDGALNHRLTSPRSHVAKTYEATLAEPLRGDEAEQFASGTLRLAGESSPLLPATLTVLDATRVAVTVHEGRYHQVRRMFAAVGNHVQALHRTAFGSVTLGDLAPGAWRLLTGDEVAALAASAVKTKGATPSTRPPADGSPDAG
ncbi:MAG: rRNA pseudouridine synthase [Gemmatimonadaceae bacterium]|nr:rRNA pseudouridine synthase [Gemmatimonadaceae bacterium]